MSKIHLFSWLCRHLTGMSIVMAVMVIGIVGVGATVTHAESTTGRACVFNAPLGANRLGHVGWGFQIDNSTFIYGSTENPNANYIIHSDGNGGYTGYNWAGANTGPTTLGFWSGKGSFQQMLNAFQRQPLWGTWPHASLDLLKHGNEYTQYKCITVTNSNVTAAENAMNVVQNSGYSYDLPGSGTGPSLNQGDLYSLAGWNCMNHVDYILSKYNAQGLPSPNIAPDEAPNYWFDDINTNPVSINGQTYSVTNAGSNGVAIYQDGPDGQGGKVSRSVSNGSYLIVVCQTTLGIQEDGVTLSGTTIPYTTWDMLADGTFVYGWYVTPDVHSDDGYSHIAGVPACVSDDTPSNW
jgi:hypothetical protein